VSEAPQEEMPAGRVLAGLVTSILAMGGVFVVSALAVGPMNSFGLWLFVLAPFLGGLVCAIICNWHKSYASGIGWVNALWAWGGSGAIALFAGQEGMVCWLMAAPLTIPLYAVGYFAGRQMMDRARDRRAPLSVSVVPLFALMTVQMARQTPGAEVRSEATELEINAPPEKVWPYLFNLPDIPETNNVLFKAGIAHPTTIRAMGSTVGDRRECVLSTGVMPERLTVVEPYRRLQFEILDTLKPLNETNPFREVHTPHDRGYFIVQQGEFLLIPLPGGRTKLVGTSRYEHHLYPAPYWSIWTDLVVEQVHRRFMNEVKARAEKQ